MRCQVSFPNFPVLSLTLSRSLSLKRYLLVSTLYLQSPSIAPPPFPVIVCQR